MDQEAFDGNLISLAAALARRDVTVLLVRDNASHTGSNVNGKQHPFKRPFPKKNKAVKDAKEPLSQFSPKPTQAAQVAKAKGRYGLLIYDTLLAAKADSEQMDALSQTVDCLNVVIRAEGQIDEDEFLRISPKVKIFAGVAWTSIHERRKEEGWYDEAQELYR